jgi:hypothetical protein
MALTEESRKKIQELALTIASDVALGAAFIAAKSAIQTFTSSNIHERNVSGDRTVNPTCDTAVLDEKKVEGNSNEASGAKDDVRGQQGNVDGSASRVNANENAAKATDIGAVALNTNAGASEISTKGLKIN